MLSIIFKNSINSEGYIPSMIGVRMWNNNAIISTDKIKVLSEICNM